MHKADSKRILTAPSSRALSSISSGDQGCAFWDMRQRMGGKAAMRDWVHAGLARQDYAHFTPAGYRRLADVLFADLMRQYEAYKRSRAERSGEISHGQPKQNR